MNPLLLAVPLAAAVIGLPVIQAGAAQDSADTEVIAAGSDGNARMTVPVRIGGAGPFRFLLDTGAQNTVVSRDLATRLNLPADRNATLVGVAGTLAVQTVLLDEIGLGRRSYYGLTAPVLEQRHIGADGIVGLDSLQDQRVLLDFRKNLIAVSDAKSLGGNLGYEIVVTARSRSGQLIMTDAVVDGIRTAVVIDTGAEGSIGNLALMQAMGRKGMLPEQTRLDSVTGQSLTADMLLARRLQIQQLFLENVAIAFADAPAFRHLRLDRKPAILLGMRELKAFRRVAIDFPTRRVLFDLPSEHASPLSW